MAGNIKIDKRFLEPLEQMMVALELSEVPLVIMCGSDPVTFADQAAAALGGTVVYTSQPDFVKQMLATMTEFHYLFSVIDEPLDIEPYKLIRAYLAARNVRDPDPSMLAYFFGARAPHTEHRLVLIIDREVLLGAARHHQPELVKFCRVVTVS